MHLGAESKAQSEGGDGLEDRIGPGEDLRVFGGPHGHVGGEGKAQGEDGDGLEDRVGPGEDLRALGGPHGHVGGGSLRPDFTQFFSQGCFAVCRKGPKETRK